MRNIEKPDTFPHRLVLGHNARVLHRHFPAAKRHHLRPAFKMRGIQRRAFQASCALHGALRYWRVSGESIEESGREIRVEIIEISPRKALKSFPVGSFRKNIWWPLILRRRSGFQPGFWL